VCLDLGTGDPGVFSENSHLGIMHFSYCAISPQEAYSKMSVVPLGRNLS
jgi:hypothetical protein